MTTTTTTTANLPRVKVDIYDGVMDYTVLSHRTPAFHFEREHLIMLSG